MKNNILINLIVIILFSSSLVSSQTISDEARSYFDRGFAAIETAKTNSDFEDALLEFENAARLAPEWSDVYYNLGFLQEKLGKPYAAVRNLKRYLELSPRADDSREVEKHIAQLEFTTEKEMKIKLRKWLIKVDREELLSSDNPDKKDLVEALTDAAFNGRNDIINALLKMGADIDGQDQREDTALIWAVCVAHKETVELLLNLGANVNIKDVYGITSLMYAASTGNVSVETMKRMIAMGADINAKDDSGRTSLIHAAKEGQIEAVKLLLDKGADINAEDTYGNTALEYAEEEGNDDIAILLLQAEMEIMELQSQQHESDTLDIFVVLAFLLSFIVYTFFWLVAMIDIIKHQFTYNNKIIWLIVVNFLPLIGLIFYFIIGRKQKNS